MKKILSLLLAVAMLTGCVLALASCGKTLKVGYTVYAPMNYFDNDGDLSDGDDGSGDFVGFDTELALLVGDKLGMKVEFVEIDWTNKYSELNSGAIDCIWNGFTSNTKDADGIERADKVDFSYAYLDNAQCVVVKTADIAAYTSAASLAGKKAAAEGGSAGETYAQSVTDADKVVAADVQTDTFTELLAGAVDFVVVDRLLADNIIGKGDYASLSIVDAIEIEKEVYSIGCKKGGDLDEKINDALVALLNEGKIEELATKYNVRVTDTLMAKKTAK